MDSFDALFTNVPRGRFEPSLNNQKRGEILALLRRGLSPATLGRVYGVHRRTVATIGRESSEHYKPIRSEYATLGRASFEQKYLTEAIVRHALSVQRGDKEASGGGLRPDPVNASAFNKHANARRGKQTFTDAFDEPRVVDIAWLQPPIRNDAGWYYQWEDHPDVWFGPFYTSASALSAAKEGKSWEIDREPS